MSNRLTFSLASLIFLIAFGLVFVAAPAMAHQNMGQTVATHTHPLNKDATEDLDGDGSISDNDDPNTGETIGPHGPHPVATVTAKPSTKDLKSQMGRHVVLLNAAGNEVATLSATSGALTFVVVVEFDKDLAAGSSLTDSEFEIRASRMSSGNRVSVTGIDGPDTDVSLVADSNKKFEVTVTVPQDAYWPTGGSILPVDVFVDISTGAVSSLETVNLDGVTLNSVPNSPYQAGSNKKFTIVSAFDETGPEAIITHKPADGKAVPTGDVTFTVAFDQALAEFTAADVLVDNGTVGTITAGTADDGTPDNSYDVTVTPTDRLKDVTLTIEADSLTDTLDNTGPEEDTSATFKPLDQIPPMVSIELLSKSDAGKHKVDTPSGDVRFKVSFTEKMQVPPSISQLEATDFSVVDENNAPIIGATLGEATVGTSAATTIPGERTGDNGKTESYILTVPDRNGLDPQEVTITLKPAQVTDLAGNTVASTGMALTSTFDTIPPTVTITPPKAPDSEGNLTFNFVFSEAVDVDSIVLDRAGSDNVRLIKGSDPKMIGTDMTEYDILVQPKDPKVDTTVLLLKGTVKDLAGNGLEADAENTYKAPVDKGEAPVFSTKIQGLPVGICEGDTLPRVVLPLAVDTEGDKLEYELRKAVLNITDKEVVVVSIGDEVRNAPPELAQGFYWEAVDAQTRLLKTKYALTSDGYDPDAKGYDATKANGYVWKVTDSVGNTDTVTFRIIVKPDAKPGAPTGLKAKKLDAASLQIPTMNRVTLTWDDPGDKSAYPTCIPAIESYTVTQSKLNVYTGEFEVQKDKTVTITAGSDFAESYTTPNAIPKGIYQFNITATNRAGTSSASDAAIWEKTGGKRVVVADPPRWSPLPKGADLRAAVDPDGDHVTVNWVKVPDDRDGEAPVYDDLVDMTHPDYADQLAKRQKFYGGDVATDKDKDFAGYAVYMINETTRNITRYPADTSKTLDIDDYATTVSPYEHPTFRVGPLAPGQYVFRVTASNVAGESERSISTIYATVTIVGAPPGTPNRAPDFGDAEIASITATVGQPIAGRFLPEATDADGDALTYSITETLPAGLKFDAAKRALTGTPTADMAETAYTYKAADAKGASDTIGFFITVKAAPTDPADPTVVYNPATKTTTINDGMINADGFLVIPASALPNLELFFSLGGSITLKKNPASGTTAAKTVVISEILWGIDHGEPLATQNKWQFIELYNTNMSGAINLAGWTLVFKEGRPAPASDVDQVSNVAGAGWIVDIGQSGRIAGSTLTGGTVVPTDLISMYRKIDYAKVQNTDGADVAKRLEGVPDGNAKVSWAASDRVTTDAGIKSSPGRKELKTHVITATSVPRSPFVINEIGNGTGGTNDWVELRNVTDAEQSLKNYQLSVVTSDKKDTQLFHFHDKDYKVPAKGVILVASTSPENTDIAAGMDVARSADDQDLTGAQNLYVVRSFDLPDSGKTLLILRKSAKSHEKQHLGTDKDIIDVVGTLSIKDTALATSLWPLKAIGGPHGNVIDGTDDEDFRAGKVYQRNNAGGGTGEKHLAVRGYTGIGYDRVASKSAVNGGTPGYDNGALKEKNADLSGATVSISEIMLEVSSGRQNTPQWIELYNSSMTNGVNLNGWKLSIENADDVDTALNATITLGAYTIAPNQTVLIVTTSGRMSDADHFPDTRVINLWTTKAHRDALQMKNRNVQVFSTTGFYFELVDKDNKLVDEVGNLDGSRRTRDEPAWALPMGEDDDRRSSLIRRYDRGTESVGTKADGWISADITNLAYAISDTYYGDPDDFGTPGFRGGGPLPVSLSKFRPERLENGSIVVRWITESELNNAGFNILRSETRDGEYTKLNTKLIAGQGTTSEKTTYEYPDTSAKPNVVYYYQIQDVSLDGKVTTLRVNRLKGHISAAGKATTTWGELKALQ